MGLWHCGSAVGDHGRRVDFGHGAAKVGNATPVEGVAYRSQVPITVLSS